MLICVWTGINSSMSEACPSRCSILSAAPPWERSFKSANKPVLPGFANALSIFSRRGSAVSMSLVRTANG